MMNGTILNRMGEKSLSEDMVFMLRLKRFLKRVEERGFQREDNYGISKVVKELVRKSENSMERTWKKVVSGNVWPLHGVWIYCKCNKKLVRNFSKQGSEMIPLM